MRTALLISIMVLIAQSACGQHNNIATASILLRRTTLQEDNTHQPFNQNLADKKLRTAGRCIISGAVLTGAGMALIIGGAAYALTPRTDQAVPAGQHQPKSGDPTAPALWICSIPFLGTGIPILTIGLVERKKWKHIKTDISVQAGILNDGQVGLAMNF